MTSIDAVVSAATLEIDGQGRFFTHYHVQAQILPAGEKWVTKHRYSGFREIHARVRALPRSQRPEKGQLPRLTGRKWFGGSTSQSVVDKRIIKLSTYLQSLCRMAQNYPAVQGILVDFLDELPSDQPRGRPAAGMEPQTALRKLSRRWGSFNGALDGEGDGEGDDDDDDDMRSQRTAGSSISASTGPAARGGGGSTVISQPSDRTMESEGAVCACCMQPLEGEGQVPEDGRLFCSSTCALFFRATAAKGFVLKAENGTRRLVPTARPPVASSTGASSSARSVLSVGGAGVRLSAAPTEERRKSSSMLRGLLRSVGLQQVSGAGKAGTTGGGAERVLYSGWLLKRGGWQGGRKTWKQRWFVLTHNALYYHKRQPFNGGNTLLGVMQLGSAGADGVWVPAAVQRLPATDAESLSFSLSRLTAPFFFLISTDKRQLYLCATNEADQRKWVDSIIYCCDPSGGAAPFQEDGAGAAVGGGRGIPSSAQHSTVFRSMVTGGSREVKRGGALQFAKAQVVTMADLNEQKAKSTPGTPGTGSVASAVDTDADEAAAGVGSGGVEGAACDTGSVGSTQGLLPPSPSPLPGQSTASVASAVSLAVPSPTSSHAGDSISRQASAGSLNGISRMVSGKRSSLFTLTGAAQWEVEDDEVEMHGKLGKGQFGDVYKGRLWGTDIAVKLLVAAGLTDEVLGSLREEVAVLSSLRHPHIVLFIGCNTSCANPFIATEYCSRGSLDRLVYDSSTPLPVPLSLRFALQCAQGVAYLHSRRGDMIHRDIKCENLLLSEGWDVKVADFGLTIMKSRVKGASGNTGEEQDLAQLDGTPQFCAPEVFEGGRVTSMVDVYAFGVVLCELFHRVLPFSDAFDRWDFIDHVLEDGATPTIPVWADVPSRFMATVEPIPSATRSALLRQAGAEVRGAAQSTRRTRASTLIERSVSDVGSTGSDGSRSDDDGEHFVVPAAKWGDDDAPYVQWVDKDASSHQSGGLGIIVTNAKVPALHPWRVWGPDRVVGDTSAPAAPPSDSDAPAIFLSPGTAGRPSISGAGRLPAAARPGMSGKAKVAETPLPAGAVDRAGGVQAAWEMDRYRPGRVAEWTSFEGDATGVIRAMVEACLHRDQDLRPGFGDLVTLLRELVALPAHDLFLCFDLPRLRETMSYADPRCQARAAREVAALCYSSMVERSVTLQLPSPAQLNAASSTASRFKMPVQRRSCALASDTGRAVDGSLAPAFARVLGGSRSPDAPLLLQQGTLLTAMPHLVAGIAGMMRCNGVILRSLCDLPLCASRGGIHGSVAQASSDAAAPGAPTAAASSAQQRNSKMALKRAARKAMDALVAQHDTVRDCVQSLVAGLQALEYCLFTWISSLHSNTQTGVQASTQHAAGQLPWAAMELLVDCDMLPVRELGRVVHALGTLAAAGRPLRKWHGMITKLQEEGAKLPRGTSSTLMSAAMEFTVSSNVQGSAARLLGTLWAVHQKHRGHIERVVSNTFGAAAIAECGAGDAAQRHLSWLCDPLKAVEVQVQASKPRSRRATVSVSTLKATAVEKPEEMEVLNFGTVVMHRVSRIVAGSLDTSSNPRVSDTVAQFSRGGQRSGSTSSARAPDS